MNANTTKKQSKGIDLPYFSVSLFYRRQTDNQTQERLICKIVQAHNEDEATGKAYRITKEEFKMFDLVYQLTVQIPIQKSGCIKIPLTMPSLTDFKAKRQQAGLSLRKVAKETGVSAATISRIERGCDADYGNVKRLHEWYGSNIVLSTTINERKKNSEINANKDK